VKRLALASPTFGYRVIHQLLLKEGFKAGRERVRKLLGELGLHVPLIRKRRKAAVAVPVTPEASWPCGQRVQIDATRFSLADGVVWVYVVQDVASRACLAQKAVRSLSKEVAKAALAAGVHRLRSLGITEPVVVQSDGGSDFTSELFQQYCQSIGHWVRSKVSQKGGMGILERLNRTLKYEFVFREEVTTLGELKDALTRFEVWYNQQRPHSALAYELPWMQLTASVPEARLAS
jgi:putative transposase